MHYNRGLIDAPSNKLLLFGWESLILFATYYSLSYPCVDTKWHDWEKMSHIS